MFELYKALEKPRDSEYGSLVQKIIFFNIVINLTTIILPYFHISFHLISVIEKITVFVFIIELFLRYLVIGYNAKYRGIIGRIKYSFTFFTIIDILTLIFYFVPILQSHSMLFRLIRFFKLFRMKNFIKNFISIKDFSSANIFIQIVVLFVFSVIFIYLFSFVYHNIKLSLEIFLDPPALSEINNNIQMFFGIIEVIFGLFIGGALISIITETLNNIVSNVKEGYYPYKGKNHIIIVNFNEKLLFILEEINTYYYNIDEKKDVVLFLPFEDDIEKIRKNLRSYSNLEIVFIKGDPLSWNSYERLNINKASKIIFLYQKYKEIDFINLKIIKLLFKYMNNKNLEFIVEIEESEIFQTVYDSVFSNIKNKYVLLNHLSVMESFLNRSIINPLYFDIFLEIVSFKGYEFYFINADKFFDREILFKDAYFLFDDSILVGIEKNNQILLNADRNTIIDYNTKLIFLAKNFNNIKREKIAKIKQYKNKYIKQPKLKETKNVCIVGEYSDINISRISQFLNIENMENITKIVKNNYFDINLWEEIKKENFDVIILNLEDDYEFILSLYLKEKFKNDDFLKNIINVMHNPLNALLLENNNEQYNIILSEKIVGKYIAQLLFNRSIKFVFDEITSSIGNEFYLLDKKNYKMLFEITDINYLRYLLFINNMIYIGVVKNQKVIINSKNLNNVSHIVVLAVGN